MLSFRNIALSDRPFIYELVSDSGQLCCDFSFGNLYVWSVQYTLEICIDNGFLYCRRKNQNGKWHYTFPLGKSEPEEAFCKLVTFCGELPELYLLNLRQLVWLEERYPDSFRFCSDTDARDYVYRGSALSELPGKKYHAKRNHIAKFYKTHSDIYTLPISGSEEIEICRSIAGEWFNERYGSFEPDTPEFYALKAAFDNYNALGFIGAVLFADSKAVAFTVGEKLNPHVCDVHFEKTLPDYKDAYPVINREFVANYLSDYELINREDDTGNENLRKAKLSYYPELLVNKYYAVPGDTCNKNRYNSLAELWENAFGDSINVIAEFLNNICSEKDIFSLCLDNRTVSALYLIDCDVKTDSGIFHGRYLYAAATLPEYRGSGLISSLIKRAVKAASSLDFIILSPANEELFPLYRQNGFDADINPAEKSLFDTSQSIDTEEYRNILFEAGSVVFGKKVYNWAYGSDKAVTKPDFCGTRALAVIFNSSLEKDKIFLYDVLE